jgi:hypothetical protein
MEQGQNLFEVCIISPLVNVETTLKLLPNLLSLPQHVHSTRLNTSLDNSTLVWISYCDTQEVGNIGIFKHETFHTFLISNMQYVKVLKAFIQ